MGFPGVIWRGEVYYVDLGQPVGHEAAFRRPAVVVSVDILNNGPGRLVVVVPVTSASYGLRSHVELAPGSSGLGHVSSPAAISCASSRPSGCRLASAWSIPTT